MGRKEEAAAATATATAAAAATGFRQGRGTLFVVKQEQKEGDIGEGANR